MYQSKLFFYSKKQKLTLVNLRKSKQKLFSGIGTSITFDVDLKV